MRPLPILALTFALALLAGCADPKAASIARPAVPVVAAPVVQKDVPVQVRIIGLVQAYSTVTVKTLVNGELTKVYFEEGQDVKKGDLLFEIDRRPFEEAVKQGEGVLVRDQAMEKQAEASLSKDRFAAQNAATEAKRYEGLMAQGIISQEQADNTRSAALAAAAAVRADEAMLENVRAAVPVDRATLATAKLNLEYCTIRSPLDGRTGSLLVYAGNVVKANDSSLVAINQILPIYVSFAAPEKYMAEIKKFMATGKLKVEALIPNEEDRPETGELSFIDNAVDATTGTIRLKGSFQNAARRLWPGQFVNARLTLSTQPGALVIPSEALQTSQSGSFVFVVKPDKTVDSRPVTVGLTQGAETVIAKGLSAGEVVVTDGQLRLVPGSRVEVKKGAGQ